MIGAGLAGCTGTPSKGETATSSSNTPSHTLQNLTLNNTYDSPAENNEGMVYDGENMYLAEYNAGSFGEHKMYQMDLSFNVIRTWIPPLPPSDSKGGINDIAYDGTHLWESNHHEEAWVKDDGNGNLLQRVDWKDVDSEITNGQGITFVDDSIAYLSAADPKKIYKYDMSTESVIYSFSTKYIESMSFEDGFRDGPWIFSASDQGNSMYLINPEAKRIIERKATVSGDPEGIEIVDSTLYFASGQGGGTGKIYEYKFDVLIL
jgi:hypothetical protein